MLIAQHFAATDMVGRADKFIFLHPVDDPGGGIIADPQLPLQPAGRGLLALEHDLAGGAVHLLLGAVVKARAIEREAAAAKEKMKMFFMDN